jgi:acyl transferase domain-containing protein
MMKNRTIPKQANFVTLSPGIEGCSHIVIPTHTRPWEVQGRRRRVALINNYGAAGSNATVVLRENSEFGTYSKIPADGFLSEQNHPLLLSATSHKSLLANLAALETWFSHTAPTENKSETLENICFNISRRQNPSFAHRFSANVTSVEDARKKLSRALATNMASGNPPPPRTPVVLCFGGQSSRTVVLSEQLYKSSTLLKHYMVSQSKHLPLI